MSFWIAMIGMAVTLAGRWQKHPNWKQQHGYFWGAVLLFISAVLDQETLLISFEAVILIGTALAFTQLKHRIKSIITISSGILALLILVLLQVQIDWHILLGMFGLILGATGFAMINDKIQLTSSVTMTTYNAVNIAAGVPAAIPFTVLNAIFGILAMRAIATKPTSYNSKTPSSPAGKIH